MYYLLIKTITAHSIYFFIAKNMLSVVGLTWEYKVPLSSTDGINLLRICNKNGYITLHYMAQ